MLQAFLGAKRALDSGAASGTVVLLGTPAEEGGGGKVALIDRYAKNGLALLSPVVSAASWQPERSALCGRSAGMRSMTSTSR